MARVIRRRPKSRTQPTPTVMPVDPNGIAAWTRRFLTWMAMQSYTARTIATREFALKRFISWCDSRSLYRPEEVTKPILERYQRHLFHYRRPTDGRPWSFRTQRMHLEAVKQLFRWLTRQNVTLWNPASELELPKITNTLPRQAFTIDEVETVLGLPDVREPLGLRDRAIMEVLYSTAMRRSELAVLSIFDFDTRRNTLLIRHGKGNRSRVVPVGERAALWLGKYLDEVRPELVLEPDDGFLFVGRLGEPVNPTYLSQLVREYVLKAKIRKPGSCHLFRHTAAVLMLEHGADIRYIQQLLGHTDLKTTEIYTHVGIEQLRRVHAMTHPGASLQFEPPPKPSADGLRISAGAVDSELDAVFESDDEEDDEANAD